MSPSACAASTMSARGRARIGKLPGGAPGRASGGPDRHGGVAPIDLLGEDDERRIGVAAEPRRPLPPGGRVRSTDSSSAPPAPSRRLARRWRQVEGDGLADVGAPGRESIAPLDAASRASTEAQPMVGGRRASRGDPDARRCIGSAAWWPRVCGRCPRTPSLVGEAMPPAESRGDSGHPRLELPAPPCTFHLRDATPGPRSDRSPEYQTDEGKRHPTRPRAHHRRPAVPRHGFPASHPGQPARVRPGAPAEPVQRQHLRHPAQRHRVRRGCAARHQGHAGDVSRRQRRPRHGFGDLRPVHARRRGRGRPGPVDGLRAELPGRVAERPPDRDPCCRPPRSSKWSRPRRS